MAILRNRYYSPETLVKIYEPKNYIDGNPLLPDDLVLLGYQFFDSPNNMFGRTYETYEIVAQSEFNDTDFFDYTSGTDNFKHYNEKI